MRAIGYLFHPPREMFHALVPLLIMAAADTRHHVFSEAIFRGWV